MVRELRHGDALGEFVLIAAFPPGSELPADALDLPHARRWLRADSDRLGVVFEDAAGLLGAAWAQRVEPVVVRAPDTGEPLPEVIVAVVAAARGRGVGRQLVAALQRRAADAGWPGLALTVSRRNPGAVRLYESCGFVAQAEQPTGLLAMAWLAPSWPGRR